MPNKITGTTDTSGGVSIMASTRNAVVIIGATSGTVTDVTNPNEVFSIAGTADAKAKFGATSNVPDMVKALVAGGVTNIKGIIVKAIEGVETLHGNYATAMTASMLDNSIKCVLLDVNTAGIITELKTHLSVAESEDMFRYAVVAPSTADNTQSALIAFAATIDNDRIFIPGPNTQIDGTAVNPQVIASGLAAAIMTETSDPALPLNSVVISGIGSVSRQVLDSERTILAGKGITVLVNEGTNTVINRLVTSSVTDMIWQEGTTRFIADTVLESVETMLRANYKRTKNVERVLKSIKTDVRTVLENFQALEIIENFDANTLTVIKDPSDAYGALIDYEFDVVTPLYTIKITQHMVL